MVAQLVGRTVISKKTTVTNSAGKVPGTAETGRLSLQIHNIGTETIYIGDANVTAAAGFPLAAGDDASFDIADGVDVYAITSSGEADVRTLEGV